MHTSRELSLYTGRQLQREIYTGVHVHARVPVCSSIATDVRRNAWVVTKAYREGRLDGYEEEDEEIFFLLLFLGSP